MQNRRVRYKKIVFLFVIFFGGVVSISLLNVRSNLHFLFPQSTAEIGVVTEKEEFENEIVKVKEVLFYRNDTSIMYRMLSSISPSKLMFIEFKKNQNNFSIIKNTALASVDDLNEGTNFIINGAFYSKTGYHIGELIIDRKLHNSRSRYSSGFF